MSEVNPERPPFNQMWGDWFPVYASTQPETVITDDMVDVAAKAMFEDGSVVSWEEASKLAKTYSGGHYGSVMGSFRRSAKIGLTAALLPTHKPLQEEG